MVKAPANYADFFGVRSYRENASDGRLTFSGNCVEVAISGNLEEGIPNVDSVQICFRQIDYGVENLWEPNSRTAGRML